MPNETDWFDGVIGRIVCLEVAVHTLLNEAHVDEKKARSLHQEIVDTIQHQNDLTDSHKKLATAAAHRLFPSLQKQPS